MFKLFALSLLLAAGPAHKDPTPPAPPTAPDAPKVTTPAAPAAPSKGEAGKGEAAPADGKAQAAKDEAKGEGGKGEGGKRDKGGEAAARAAARAADKKAAQAAQRDRANPPAPPALTGSALRQEMRQTGGEDRAAPMSERQRLEQLAAEITRAREALRQDTARLEAMLKGGAGGDMRMPMGDPTDPMAGRGLPPGEAASKEAMKDQILTVSKAMKGMKPEQAAPILARLDRALAAEILRRMPPAAAGAVLGQIKPELAAELATAIATRKPMIDDGKAGKK